MSHKPDIYDSVYLSYACFVRAGAPARYRIALEMQLHTEIELQGCLLFFTQRGRATGQTLARASQTQVANRATDVGGSTAQHNPRKKLKQLNHDMQYCAQYLSNLNYVKYKHPGESVVIQ